jgi:hypothetical protein
MSVSFPPSLFFPSNPNNSNNVLNEDLTLLTQHTRILLTASIAAAIPTSTNGVGVGVREIIDQQLTTDVNVLYGPKLW